MSSQSTAQGQLQTFDMGSNTKVDYICSKKHHLTVGLRDLYQAEKKITVIFTQNGIFFSPETIYEFAQFGLNGDITVIFISAIDKSHDPIVS